MIRVAVNGCCGKMGQRIMSLAGVDSEIQVTVALEKTGHPALNTDAGGVTVTDNARGIDKADVIIDFTSAEATMLLLEEALRYKKALVIGTTGLDSRQIKRIQEAACIIPVVLSPNMSVGVNLLFRLIKEAAFKLKDHRVRIKEAHHVHKKDAPSGTAKKMAEIVQAASARNVNDIQSIREGEIIGDHEISFDSDMDTLIIKHSAKTRDILAEGALKAAKWVAGKPAGFYSMQDVLGK